MGLEKNFLKDIKLILDSVPDPYLILSPNLKIVAASNEYLKITMLERDEILGQLIFDVLPDNFDNKQAGWKKNLGDSLNRLLENKCADMIPLQKYNIRLPMTEGGDLQARYWTILNWPIQNKDNNIEYIIHRIEDATFFINNQNKQLNIIKTSQTQEHAFPINIFKSIQDIQALNKQLQEKESYNKAFLAAVPDAMLLVNQEGEITFVNEQVENIFGYNKDELLGQQIEILIPGPFAKRHPQHRNNYFKSPRVRPMGLGMELRAKRKNGQIFPVEISLSPLQTDNELTAIAIIRDITHRIEQNKLLQESENSLRKMYKKVEHERQVLEKSNQKMLFITQLSETLLVCKNIAEIIETIAIFVNKVLDFSEGALYLMNNLHKRLELKFTWKEKKQNLTDFLPEECWALRRNYIHYFTKEELGLQCKHIKQHTNKEQSYVCTPLIGQNEVYGLISFTVDSDNLFFDRYKNLIPIVAETISLSIANIKLKGLLHYHSMRDPLTGLLNRRFLEEYALKQISQANHKHSHITFLMIDIDNFKLINDLNGHEIGDLVLSKISYKLKHLIRTTDVACRYGGEEFLCILPDCNIKHGKKIAEQLRKEIQKVSLDEKEISISISLGISMYPEDGLTLKELIKAADQALHHAKKTGKNKVIVYSGTKN